MPSIKRPLRKTGKPRLGFDNPLLDGGEQNLALDVFDQGCYLLDVTWRAVIGRDLKQNPHALIALKISRCLSQTHDGYAALRNGQVTE